ncbi:MAG: HNH endonuclease [Phycisphaerales bacterium]|nr:HNH endonuclease [Phycisphaerales bacterium]
MVYFCSGTDSERLEWFRTINIAGENLTDQELRNAVYAGPWTADAKRYFSKTGCAAYGLAGDYLRGVAIRQEYLETAIEWHMEAEGVKSIEEYMGRHQHDPSEVALWNHFRSVIDWTKATFPKYRKEMKGVAWGPLFNEFGAGGKGGKKALDPKKLEKQVADLMEDEDVTSKPGIYSYVLDGDESHLNIRAFSPNMKREAYERQKGKCPKCPKKDQRKLDLGEMEGDHIKPWHEGGKTDAKNCQMLCKDCNRRKAGK